LSAGTITKGGGGGDVNQVELAAFAFVGGIYADEAAVGAEGVDRVWDGAPLACVDVEDVADESLALAVIPDDLGLGAGYADVHHADLDDVVGPRGAALEVHLHPQDVAAGGVELEFVVVAEPMEFRAGRDDAARREVLASANRRCNEEGQTEELSRWPHRLSSSGRFFEMQ